MLIVPIILALYERLSWQSLKQYLEICCCSVAPLCLTLCDPLTAAHQASLSFIISQSLEITTCLNL